MENSNKIFNFKIPIIGAIIIFFLIFFINLIVGNSFFVILLRSIVSGLVTFGVIFGVVFYFQNYLELTLENKEETKDKPNIDIVLDDENAEGIDNKFADSFEENATQVDGLNSTGLNGLEENQEEDELVEQFSDEKKSTDKSIDQTAFDNINLNINEDNINLGSNLDNVDENNIEFIKDNYKEEEMKSNEQDSDDYYSSFDLDDSKTEDNEAEIYEDLGDSFKKKIGHKVSFEDAAKAVRTKMREED